MKYVFSVGKKEKHEVEVSSGQLTALIVKVDGKEIFRKTTLPIWSDSISIPIGKREKHELRIIPGTRKKIYVDGKPFRIGAERVHEDRGEEEWIGWVVFILICFIVAIIAALLYFSS